MGEHISLILICPTEFEYEKVDEKVDRFKKHGEEKKPNQILKKKIVRDSFLKEERDYYTEVS